MEAEEEELLKNKAAALKSARFSYFLKLMATKYSSESILTQEQISEFIEVYELFTKRHSVNNDLEKVEDMYIPMKDIATCLSSLDYR